MSPPRSQRALRLSVFVIAAAVSASGARPAAAHPVPFSYLDLRLGPDAIDGSLVVHVSDAAHDLTIEPAERLIDPDLAAQQSAALASLLGARFTVSADGRALAPQWSAVKVLTGRQSLKLPFRFALDGRPGRLTVSAGLFPYDPRHQTFLNLYEGDEVTQAILDRGHPGFESFAQAQLKAGKTPEQGAAEWKVPEKYKGYSTDVRMGRLKGQFETLAAEMKK